MIRAIKIYSLHTLIALGLLAASLHSFALPRETSLQYLAQWQSMNQQHLQKIDRQLHKRQLPKAPEQARKPLASNSLASNDQTAHLQRQKAEFQLRQQLIQQLRFQFVSHYRGRGLKAFLLKTLKQMSSQEALSTSSDLLLWSFISHLRKAVQGFPRTSKNALALLEGYVRSSSILDPKKASELTGQQNYSNGFHSLRAKTVNTEMAGDIAAKRIAESVNNRIQAKFSQSAEMNQVREPRAQEWHSEMNEPSKPAKK